MIRGAPKQCAAHAGAGLINFSRGQNIFKFEKIVVHFVFFMGNMYIPIPSYTRLFKLI